MRNYIRPVDGSPDVIATADGEVLSCRKTGEYEPLRSNQMGGGKTKGASYPAVFFDGKNHYVQRVIAEAFLGKPEGKETNHINGDKQDNRIENLEYLTASENMLHAYKTGLRVPAHLGVFGSDHPGSKPILCLDTGIRYVNARVAAKDLGIGYRGISAVVTGARKTYKGSRWRYA